METKNLDDLHGDPSNPRRMSKHDAAALNNSIRQFGDLSCVVFNVRTQQLVGGHQRLEIMKRIGDNKQVQISHRQEPDDVGTVALGYVVIGTKQFAYREVDWPIEKQKAANIAANRIQGEFDLDLLAEANQFLEDQAPDLLEMTGQTETERDHLKRRNGPDPETDEPKNDDGSRPFEVRLSEAQLSVVENAIATMKRNRQLTMELNSDLNGNALFYICEQYLQSEPLPPQL
jgi:hypothetical protein